jgi:hypothetical protein
VSASRSGHDDIAVPSQSARVDVPRRGLTIGNRWFTIVHFTNIQHSYRDRHCHVEIATFLFSNMLAFENMSLSPRVRSTDHRLCGRLTTPRIFDQDPIHDSVVHPKVWTCANRDAQRCDMSISSSASQGTQRKITLHTDGGEAHVCADIEASNVSSGAWKIHDVGL